MNPVAKLAKHVKVDVYIRASTVEKIVALHCLNDVVEALNLGTANSVQVRCADIGNTLRQLRRRDDAAHRQERPLSLLCLLDPGAAGRHRLQGGAIPMDKLDRMVVSHIEERLLDPERIEDMLASLLDRRQESVQRRGRHIAELNHRAAEADMRLKRLYDAIEAGSLDPAESALGERIAGLTALRDQARADAARTEAMLKSSAHQGLTGAAVRELATEARTRLRLGEGGYRREHVRAFAQRVEVADDAIYIKGSKGTLLRTLVAAKGGKSAGIGVPGFIPKWRRERDCGRTFSGITPSVT